ncbi:MAG: amidohydrolase [Woeseiaceae bacterium]|nr:amidohydrolase [Woeseiaceae bacterium]
MKIRLLLLLSVLMLAACTQKPADESGATFADVIFVNGAVYTVDAARSWATTVAVRGDRIVYVGHDDAQALRGPDTRIVDLGGRMLMPSFQDIHIHPITSGMEFLTVNLYESSNVAEYVEAVAAYAAANPDAEWLTGAGWTVDAFGPGAKADKALLDAVVPDRPVYLESADGHTAWVNSKALEIAGVDRDTQDPAGGLIDRDPDTGEAFGSLQEPAAMDLVGNYIPAPTPEFVAEALKYAVDLLNSYGITAMTDAKVRPYQLPAYRALEERGELTVRTTGSLRWDPTRGLEQIEEFKRQREEFSLPNFRPTSVKITQDGVMENYTAVMSEPYFVEGNPTGIPMVDPEFLKEVVTALDAEGFQVHFHAIGDAAVTQCLDAIEAAIEANGHSRLRHHISHLQAIRPDDLPRFRELDIIANFQPKWAYADSYITELTLPFIGKERGNWMYTIRSVVNAGGMIAFGSDWAVDTANPFLQLETAVMRHDAEGPVAIDETWMLHETIDLQTALAAFTINSAYVNGIDDVSGSIEVGKLADMIVLDRNLFDIPPAEISETKVLLTLFGGRPVHGSFALAGE